MADNKAYLESIARSFGYFFGKNKKVRVNTISQSPTRTTAGQGVEGLDKLTIRSPSGGPPGRDLDVRFQGEKLETLKIASNELIQIARTIPGVTSLNDNLEFGVQERILSLNNKGQSLGLSISDIGEQVRSAINGIIISNTTNQNREKLLDSKKDEVGGLSGQPIKNISTNLIKKFYKELNRKITIIGVGGIDSGKSAFEKITAGADVIQLYTGMVYRGPGVVKEIKKELISILKNDKIKNISDAVGINT